MRGAVVSLLIVPLLIPSTSLSTQEQPPIESGARVRITSTDPVLVKSVGTCLELSEGHLQFASGTTAEFWSIDVDSITALDVSRGRKPFGVLKGAGIGLLVGVVVYSNYPDREVDEGNVGILVGGAFGAAGALVGAGVGTLVRTDRWEEVPLERLRLRPVATFDGRFGLAASVRF